MSGLDHLEGETVAILADGSYSTGTVSNGQITLSRASTLVHIGLPYVADLESLNISAFHKKKNISSLSILFKDSRGAKMGRDSNNLDDIRFSDEADGENPPALFSGAKVAGVSGTYEYEARIFIRQDAPLPVTILSIAPEVTIAS